MVMLVSIHIFFSTKNHYTHHRTTIWPYASKFKMAARMSMFYCNDLPTVNNRLIGHFSAFFGWPYYFTLALEI